MAGSGDNLHNSSGRLSIQQRQESKHSALAARRKESSSVARPHQKQRASILFFSPFVVEQRRHPFPLSPFLLLLNSLFEATDLPAGTTGRTRITEAILCWVLLCLPACFRARGKRCSKPGNLARSSTHLSQLGNSSQLNPRLNVTLQRYTADLYLPDTRERD